MERGKLEEKVRKVDLEIGVVDCGTGLPHYTKMYPMNYLKLRFFVYKGFIQASLSKIQTLFKDF